MSSNRSLKLTLMVVRIGFVVALLATALTWFQFLPALGSRSVHIVSGLLVVIGLLVAAALSGQSALRTAWPLWCAACVALAGVALAIGWGADQLGLVRVPLHWISMLTAVALGEAGAARVKRLQPNKLVDSHPRKQ